jgi:hypothetical protein
VGVKSRSLALSYDAASPLGGRAPASACYQPRFVRVSPVELSNKIRHVLQVVGGDLGSVVIARPFDSITQSGLATATRLP